MLLPLSLPIRYGHPANSADRARIKPMCTPPVDYDSTERITEIAEILAAGLMRLRARKSSQKSSDCGEISLDILADQSGPDPYIAGENRP